jgi:archaellum component FlaC
MNYILDDYKKDAKFMKNKIADMNNKIADIKDEIKALEDTNYVLSVAFNTLIALHYKEEIGDESLKNFEKVEFTEEDSIYFDGV